METENRRPGSPGIVFLARGMSPLEEPSGVRPVRVTILQSAQTVPDPRPEFKDVIA